MIKRKGDNYILTIPAHLISENHIRCLMEWLSFEELRQKSQLTESVARELSEAAKENWWKENSARILSKIGENEGNS